MTKGAPEKAGKQGGKRKRYVAGIVIFFHVVGFFCSIHAVMYAPSSQSAVAWGISLNTFPYIAVPAYMVIGRRKFHGYVTARQGDLNEITQSVALAAEKVRPYISNMGREYPAVRAGERLAKMPLLTGNYVELLIDGRATFDSILQGIAQAEDYILVQFYIVRDDDIGRTLKNALMAKAKAGVRVYFIYDEIGSYKLPDAYKDDMRSTGIEVYNFHTRKGPKNRFQINFRNHRKIVVVDGRAAWVGGHNVGDEYLGRDPKVGPWRDTHVRITGPAVQAVQLPFLEDYHWATDNTLALNWNPQPGGKGGQEVLIVPSGPADSLDTAALMYIHAINSAKERVWIASPYFVPDEAVLAALQLAGLRGVDVRIMIPGQYDILLVYLAAFSYFEDAKKTGVRIYRYQEGFLHQKVMLVDDAVSAVGTVNFDNRAFRLNFEITALVIDPDFASQVEKMLLDDFARTIRVTPEDYNDKPFWFKLAVRFARLTAPLL